MGPLCQVRWGERHRERGQAERGNTDSGRGGVNRKAARRVAEGLTGGQERRQAEERLGLPAGARGEQSRTRTGEPASAHPESPGPSRWSSGLAGHADLGLVSENPIMRRAGEPRAPENAQRSQSSTSSAGRGRGGTVRGHSGLAQAPARQRLGRQLHTHTGLNVEKSTVPAPGTALRGSPQKRGELRTEQRAVGQAAGSPSSHLSCERERAGSPASGAGATGFSFGRHKTRSIPPTR